MYLSMRAAGSSCTSYYTSYPPSSGGGSLLSKRDSMHNCGLLNYCYEGEYLELQNSHLTRFSEI